MELLRIWFGGDPPRPALEHALRRAGSAVAEPPPPVRALVYLGEIGAFGRMDELGAAHELLGHAARDGRAFLEAYETSLSHIGDRLAVSGFERPPFRTRPDEGLVGGTRFAREVARAALEQGVVVRGVVCVGEGAVYDDASGRFLLIGQEFRSLQRVEGSATQLHKPAGVDYGPAHSHGRQRDAIAHRGSRPVGEQYR